MFKNKAIVNAIALFGVLAIALFFSIIGYRKNKAESDYIEPIISEDDRLLDSLNHPELAQDDAWIEVRSEDDTSVSYLNTEMLSCPLYLGGTLTVGVIADDVTDKLLINPMYFNAADAADSRYGIYVSSQAGEISYSSVPRLTLNDISDSCYVITDRTYDTFIPSASGTYFSVYSNSPVISDDNGCACVYIRVVRLDDFTVIGTAVLNILWNGSYYYMDSLLSSDIADTDEFDSSLRLELINKAIEYIFNPYSGPSFGTVFTDYLDVMQSFATVENCKRPYFNKLLASDGSCISAGSISNCDLIAVNVPYIGCGSITVYSAPELQVSGFNLKSVFFDEDIEYVPFAYDFLYPFSKDTLLVPEFADYRFYS